jgi:hypothetical protein
MKLFWKNDLIMPLNTSKSNFIVQITHLKWFILLLDGNFSTN